MKFDIEEYKNNPGHKLITNQEANITNQEANIINQ